MRGETAASRVLPTTTLPPFPPHFQLFNDAIRLAVAYKESSQDFMDEVLQELEVSQAQFQVCEEKEMISSEMCSTTQDMGFCLPLRPLTASEL